MIKLKLFGPNSRWDNPTVLFVEDSTSLTTATGRRRAADLRIGKRATALMPGHVIDGREDREGQIRYWSRVNAAASNTARIVHRAGPFGFPHANRPLTVDVTSEGIVVTFGTDADCNTVRPTSWEVQAAFFQNPLAMEHFEIAMEFNGGGLVGLGEVQLAGGEDTGDAVKLPAGGGYYGRVGWIEVL